MPFQLTYTIEDEKQDKAQMSVWVPDTNTPAEIQSFSDTFAAALDALIDGRITGASLSLPLTTPGGLKGAALSGSDVEEGIRAIWLDTAGYRTSHRIPTAKESLILAGSRLVDTTDPAWITYNGLMTAGDGTVGPTGSRGDSVVNPDSAVEAFQRSRKRR